MTDRNSDVFDVIARRRKVRRFTGTPMPEEDPMKIPDEARRAPSSEDQQP
jgi:nitroreductase